jgi:integrase
MAAYEAAIGGAAVRPTNLVEIGASRTMVGTVNHAIVGYYQSGAFAALAVATRAMRRAVLERFRIDHGDKRIALLRREHVARLLGKLKPYAQRNMLKTLRGLMAFALADCLIEADPTLGVKPARVGKSAGFYSWTEDDIAAFERHHAVGTKPRLAFALMLYLGLRRSDVVRIGPQHVRNGMVSFKPQKTKGSTGFVLHCPLHPDLAAIIAATPSEHLTFLATEFGKPFAAAGFGNWMRERCDEAGLKHCSSHGLRKGCARRLAEAGASVNEIAAVTGHADLREVEVYTRAADNGRMAGAAMARMHDAFGPKSEQKLPNRPIGFGNSGKKSSVIKDLKTVWRPRLKSQ